MDEIADTIYNIRLGTITNKIVLMDHLVGLINKSDRILKWNYGLARIDSPFDQHGIVRSIALLFRRRLEPDSGTFIS